MFDNLKERLATACQRIDALMGEALVSLAGTPMKVAVVALDGTIAVDGVMDPHFHDAIRTCRCDRSSD